MQSPGFKADNYFYIIVFANAGILDVADFYQKSDTLPPPEPSLLTSKVSCDGAIYSAYLAMHYFRRNPTPGGSLIVTSSGMSNIDY
jgi:15-hydroxyprostaglandin dehydrogenase (NAD)